MNTLKVEVLPKERNGFLFLEGQGMFQLLEDFTYEDEVLGSILIPAGFITDFCSIPAPFRIVFPIAGKAAVAGTLHDWLLRSDDTKRHAAAVFNRALKAGGVFFLRRWCMVGFVSAFTFFDIYL